jgi:hypothetical protein
MSIDRISVHVERGGQVSAASAGLYRYAPTPL